MAADADLVLAVLDGSRPIPDAVWRACRDALRPGRWVAVVNKIDLPAVWEVEQIPAGFRAVVPASARTGEGTGDLRSAILSGLGFHGFWGVEPALFSVRQMHGVGTGPVPLTGDRVQAAVGDLLGEA